MDLSALKALKIGATQYYLGSFVHPLETTKSGNLVSLQRARADCPLHVYNLSARDISHRRYF